MADIYAEVKLNLDKAEEGKLRKKIGSIDTRREGKQVATRFGVGFNGAIGSIISRSAGIFAAGFAAVKVGGFLKDAITQASDLGETTSKVAQIFGPAAKDIMAFSKTSATALGQTQQAALDANATFGIFGKSAGLKGTALTGFTTKLTTLAGDLASFNNTSPEQAIEAIGAALRGETEPMRAYGVLLDDASLRQEALAQGLIKTTKQALTPQQKVLAAQALIMKQTTTAQGDFARTSGGLANQQRILSAQFANFKTTIGAVALPLVTSLFGFLNNKAIPILTTVAGGVTAFGSAFQNSSDGITSSGFAGFMERLGIAAAGAFATFQTQVIPRLKEFGGFLRDQVLPVVVQFVGFVVTSVIPAVVGFGRNLASSLGPAVKDVFTFFRDQVLPRLQDFAGFLGSSVLPMIGQLASSFSKNKDFLVPFVATIVVLIGAIKTWAIVQGILNVVLSANPIGLVIIAIAALVGGLVWAYKNSDTFRKIVDTAFKVVRASAVAMWDNYLKPMFITFAGVLKFVWTQAQGFARILSAAWGAIKEPARLAIRYVVGVFLGMVDTLLTGAAKAFGWVPGLGGKLRGAAAAFSRFRDDVNARLAGIRDQEIKISPVVVAAQQARRNAVANRLPNAQLGRAFGGEIPGNMGVRGKDSVPALLMPDEHVWTTRETAAVGGHGAMKRLRAAALAGQLRGFANGGGVRVRTDLPNLNAPMANIAAVAKAVARPIAQALGNKLSQFSPGLNGVLNFVRSQVGKPYLWGGVGPGGYDCSGLVAAAVNVAYGKRPYSRLGSTKTMPWASMTPGVGPFMIGWTNAGVGHTAATVNGVNIESSGGVGVHMGASARGAANRLFTHRMKVKGFAAGGPGREGIDGQMPFDLLNSRGKNFLGRDLLAQLGVKRYDRGGAWPNNTLGMNTSGKTETVVPGGGAVELGPDSIRALGKEIVRGFSEAKIRLVHGPGGAYLLSNSGG